MIGRKLPFTPYRTVLGTVLSPTLGEGVSCGAQNIIYTIVFVVSIVYEVTSILLRTNKINKIERISSTDRLSYVVSVSGR